jgi:hypothetical protein
LCPCSEGQHQGSGSGSRWRASHLTTGVGIQAGEEELGGRGAPRRELRGGLVHERRQDVHGSGPRQGLPRIPHPIADDVLVGEEIGQPVPKLPPTHDGLVQVVPVGHVCDAVQGVRVAVAGSGEKGNRSAFGQIGSRIVRSEGRVYARVVWCAGARSPSSVAFPFAQFTKFTKWRTQSVFAFSHEVESPASLSLAFCFFGPGSAISRVANREVADSSSPVPEYGSPVRDSRTGLGAVVGKNHE